MVLQDTELLDNSLDFDILSVFYCLLISILSNNNVLLMLLVFFLLF